MSNPLVVDIFVEDRAHEAFVKPLLTRLAREEDIEAWPRVRSATGGHGRAISEFKLYQRVTAQSGASSTLADLVVVAIDGNCSTFAAARKRLQDTAIAMVRDRLVVACPDPHIERWYRVVFHIISMEDPRLIRAGGCGIVPDNPLKVEDREIARR